MEGRPAYWRESSQPLTSLVFVAPMLVVYEAGVLLVDERSARNGAELWLRGWLDQLGFSACLSYFLLPALTCGLLLAWHHTRNEPWRLRWDVLSGMAFESTVLAIGLLLFAQWQQEWIAGLARGTPAATRGAATDSAAALIAYLGAGIYEELLFRLALLPAAVIGLRWCGLDRRTSLAAAIVLTSALFALAHYRLDVPLGAWRLHLPYGDAFAWSSFSFRFLAGVFFASLFAARGFGIAAGSHALYDIFAVLL